MLGYCRMEEGEEPGVNSQQGLPREPYFHVKVFNSVLFIHIKWKL